MRKRHTREEMERLFAELAAEKLTTLKSDWVRLEPTAHWFAYKGVSSKPGVLSVFTRVRHQSQPMRPPPHQPGEDH